MARVTFILSLLSCVFVALGQVSKVEYMERVINATNTLDQWYNTSTGLWQHTWWNSGCMLTTMGNIALIDKSVFADAIDSYQTTTFHRSSGGNYFDAFYDDEGWWALGWIKAYDVTGNSTYLDMAVTIFDNLLGGLHAKCGGHWWNKASSSKSGAQANTAIGNGLYFATAAALGNRIPGNASYYLSYSQAEADFFFNSGMLDTNRWIVKDSLSVGNGLCQPGLASFSYDNGAYIGGLVEHAKLSGNSSYLDVADKVANGTIYMLSDKHNGVLTEQGYPSPLGPTLSQFKGVFIRNLMYLHQARPNSRWVRFIQHNANTIWDYGRWPNGTLSALWQGPLLDESSQSQSSALDCLVAAATVTTS